MYIGRRRQQQCGGLGGSHRGLKIHVVPPGPYGDEATGSLRGAPEGKRKFCRGSEQERFGFCETDSMVRFKVTPLTPEATETS